jgi:ubiquinone/menaquinone biosynthesis C-methylase UbiE
MDDRPKARVRRGYDRAAASYLAARPEQGADMALLAELTRHLSPGDRVLDAGCGAGVPVARALTAGGFDVTGLDLSSSQLGLAQAMATASTLVQGDLAALPLAARSFAAAVSYYAIIHVPRSEHLQVFAEVRRVLRPGGLALLCLGARNLPEDHDPDSWLGVAMYWSHFGVETNLELVGQAGLDLVWSKLVTDPMGHGEHLFVLARREPEPATTRA